MEKKSWHRLVQALPSFLWALRKAPCPVSLVLKPHPQLPVGSSWRTDLSSESCKDSLPGNQDGNSLVTSELQALLSGESWPQGQCPAPCSGGQGASELCSCSAHLGGGDKPPPPSCITEWCISNWYEWVGVSDTCQHSNMCLPPEPEPLRNISPMDLPAKTYIYLKCFWQYCLKEPNLETS